MKTIKNIGRIVWAILIIILGFAIIWKIVIPFIGTVFSWFVGLV